MRRSIAIFLCLSALITAAIPRASYATDAKPYFLVASPEMRDPIFRRSVIMMVPTTQAPLLAGVIINEPTGTSAQEVFPHFPALKNDLSSAYYGGPVDNGRPTIALRTRNPPAHAVQVFEDVYVTTDADSIAQILKDHTAPANLRIFLGRAQWLEDQLQSELMREAWYIVPPDADLAFSADPTHLWRKLVARGQLQETKYRTPIFIRPIDLPIALDGGVVWPSL
jgi:putative transcriptional regulator